MRYTDPSGRESKGVEPPKGYSVGECIGGVIIFVGTEFVGTTLVVGGVLLQGFSFTIFGVTFGGAAPVTAAGFVAGTALDLAGFAIDIGGPVVLKNFCYPPQL